MAIPWIKVEVGLRRKPAVKRLARILGVEPDLVVGKLVRLWSWADEVTEDGVIQHATKSDVDEEVGAMDFADALEEIGWLKSHNDSVELVNYTEHNGSTAKSRAQTARRQAKHKQRVNAEVTVGALPEEVTVEALPDKIRGDKNKNTAPAWTPGGGWDSSLIADLAPDYPRLDVPFLFGAMHDWLSDNAKRRPKNYRRFAINWLKREADRLPPAPKPPKSIPLSAAIELDFRGKEVE